MNRWFSNLRGRLIASHIVVILITVLLMVIISAGLLREYAADLEDQRLKEIAAPLTLATNLIGRERGGGMRLEAIDDLAISNDVRVMVFGPDARVVYDTSGADNLSGIQLTAYAGGIAAAFEQAASTGAAVQVFVTPEPGLDDPFRDERLLVAVTGRPNAMLMVGIAAPERRYPLLNDYLPGILLVTAISIAAASLAGYLLSRRIAAPIGQLTAAANAMQEGHLAQHVPGAGDDELGRLVASFNDMSSRVAATYDSQRTLLADVAHELRTPLTSVQGYSMALQDGVITSPEDRNRALAVIEREAQRMSVLIVQLLDLARLESRQVILAAQPVDMTAVMSSVEERLGPEAAAKGITLAVSSTGNPTLLGDQERVNQILTNLVSNAIRNTPEGGTVAMKSTGPPGNGRSAQRIVTIDVTDTGTGISSALLPHIFDRFTRGDHHETDRGGFGLGLAIVKELTERQGGTVTVESATGKGATFRVTLPSA